MTSWAWIQVLAATSGLVVAALALSRSGRDPLSLPLVLLALDQFAWNIASVGVELTRDERYAWLGSIAAPLFVPMAFHFVLRFVGRARAHRGWLIAIYSVFIARSVVAFLDFVVPGFDLPGGLDTYAAMLLLTGLPVGFAGLLLVWRHIAATPSLDEKRRGRVVLAALIAVIVLLPADLLADMGLPVPRLATLGSFAFNLALASVLLGTSVVSGSRKIALAQALAVGLFIAAAYLMLFVTFSQRLGILIVSMTVLSLGLVAAVRLAIVTLSTSRAGLERYATFGRFSAQMAHDLKNPLAAARGAAEFLAEEMRRSGQAVTQQEFAALIVQQLDRLEAIIVRYQQLSKLELSLATVDVNALINRVLALQGFATHSHVTMKLELDPALLPLTADAELLSSALENLVKNALEAMPKEGTLTVTSAMNADAVHLAVRDTGSGMAARTLEQAFTPFFTTKASGSGMGLAFVRQVARAHGGDATVHSTEGLGTVVELQLPRSAHV